jgi:ribosomal protein S16
LTWNKRYEELVDYRKEHGHSMVPTESQTHKELGDWVHTQRQLYKKRIQGKLTRGALLSDERIRLLNEEHFVWDPHEDFWRKRYQELVEYYKVHGHSMVPQTSQTHKELGRWVVNQRELYKKRNQGKLSKGTGISDERMRLLSEVEFVWDPFDSQWRAQYQRLEKHIRIYGPLSYIKNQA